MLKPILAAGFVLCAAPALAQTCLHGPGETAENTSRREQALQFAVRINLAQNLPGPGGRYRQPSEMGLPSMPPGFALQFHADADGYSFSLKDTLDPCRYAIFSDQERDIYEGTPKTGGVVVPAATEGSISSESLQLKSRRANQSERPSGHWKVDD
jgi:hypothetical protein